MFEGVGHSVWQGKTDETGASNILFDIFNSYRRLSFSHIFALSEAVPHLFCKFFPVKNFHTFSSRRKILHSLARFLQGVFRRHFSAPRKACADSSRQDSPLHENHRIQTPYTSIFRKQNLIQPHFLAHLPKNTYICTVYNNIFKREKL